MSSVETKVELKQPNYYTYNYVLRIVVYIDMFSFPLSKSEIAANTASKLYKNNWQIACNRIGHVIVTVHGNHFANWSLIVF